MGSNNSICCYPVGGGGHLMDNEVQMVRWGVAALTHVLPRGNTERMIAFVTDVVVLTKRVAK